MGVSQEDNVLQTTLERVGVFNVDTVLLQRDVQSKRGRVTPRFSHVKNEWKQS